MIVIGFGWLQWRRIQLIEEEEKKRKEEEKKREGSGCKYICIKELSEKGGKIGKGSVLCCAVCDGHRGGVCDAPVCRRSVPSP